MGSDVFLAMLFVARETRLEAGKLRRTSILLPGKAMSTFTTFTNFLGPLFSSLSTQELQHGQIADFLSYLIFLCSQNATSGVF
jgi:molybdopterin biosynthesis enzyme